RAHPELLRFAARRRPNLRHARRAARHARSRDARPARRSSRKRREPHPHLRARALPHRPRIRTRSLLAKNAKGHSPMIAAPHHVRTKLRVSKLACFFGAAMLLLSMPIGAKADVRKDGTWPAAEKKVDL